MGYIDAYEIINSAKAGAKSGNKKEDGDNTDTTINQETGKNRNSQTRQGGARKGKY